MYKEIEFAEEQKGYGLVFTNPLSGIRGLTGIFNTSEEADRSGREWSKQGHAIRPEVVTWDRATYDQYDWVFKRK